MLEAMWVGGGVPPPRDRRVVHAIGLQEAQARNELGNLGAWPPVCVSSVSLSLDFLSGYLVTRFCARDNIIVSYVECSRRA